MLKIITNIASAAVKTALLPATLAADVVGVIASSDSPRPYQSLTGKMARGISENIKDIADD